MQEEPVEAFVPLNETTSIRFEPVHVCDQEVELLADEDDEVVSNAIAIIFYIRFIRNPPFATGAVTTGANERTASPALLAPAKLTVIL